ncbi:MAG: cytochrome c-type biogenesis protein CcmH [Thiopseudomonas sp.]|jgi:cytochrome c-type biogenesis protein CcmH|uniref:cytochrome c-type biogenesis protein n=1 Tax=Denitrificimonas caeni TaxID=521720 RepID=UPI0003B6DA72|nr:cytochrome c-type biogenesis protein [Denitrificimonas caeni]MBP7189359.1 cytochrome c-type biogenesis protein CcmH [Thiopseudomonas sp.]MBP8008125.1 cytochrome c-type biogenesis protein CcmH [Thiopseudomonas sp.]HHX05757.1 cytochrome c-type biogenesis protein CcmH [Pseudomonas sp.]
MKRFIYALGLTLACFGTAQASIDTYEFSTQAERDRYRTLVEELRCPKCQNQNIADSDAPIAMDMRDEIFKKLEEGQSNEQIVEFLVDRYGDFVRYKPPVNKKTLILWYGPAAFLTFGFAMVAMIVIRRRRSTRTEQNEQQLSSDEKARLSDILKQDK